MALARVPARTAVLARNTGSEGRLSVLAGKKRRGTRAGSLNETRLMSRASSRHRTGPHLALLLPKSPAATRCRYISPVEAHRCTTCIRSVLCLAAGESKNKKKEQRRTNPAEKKKILGPMVNARDLSNPVAAEEGTKKKASSEMRQKRRRDEKDGRY